MKIKTVLTLLLILFLLGCSTQETDTDADATDTTPNDTVPDTTPATDDTTDTGTDTTPNDTQASADEDTAPEPVPEETTHVIEINNTDFIPEEITIEAGDTVVFKNVRSGRFEDALILGASYSDCRDMESPTFGPGEEFSYTFEEPGKCVFIDAIITTIAGEIIIE